MGNAFGLRAAKNDAGAIATAEPILAAAAPVIDAAQQRSAENSQRTSPPLLSQPNFSGSRISGGTKRSSPVSFDRPQRRSVRRRKINQSDDYEYDASMTGSSRSSPLNHVEGVEDFDSGGEEFSALNGADNSDHCISASASASGKLQQPIEGREDRQNLIEQNHDFDDCFLAMSEQGSPSSLADEITDVPNAVEYSFCAATDEVRALPSGIENFSEWNTVLITTDMTLRPGMINSYFGGLVRCRKETLAIQQLTTNEMMTIAAAMVDEVLMTYTFAEEQPDGTWTQISRRRAIQITSCLLCGDLTDSLRPSARAMVAESEVEPSAVLAADPVPIQPNKCDVRIGHDGVILKCYGREVIFGLISTWQSNYANAATSVDEDNVVLQVIQPLNESRIRFLKKSGHDSWTLLETPEIMEVLHREFSRNKLADRRELTGDNDIRTVPLAPVLSGPRRKLMKHSIAGLVKTGSGSEHHHEDNAKCTGLDDQSATSDDEVGVELKEEDIIVGPGKYSNEGNQYYSCLIDTQGPNYRTCEPDMQEKVVLAVVDELYAENRRFVRKTRNGYGEVVDYEAALKKVRLALVTWHQRGNRPVYKENAFSLATGKIGAAHALHASTLSDDSSADGSFSTLGRSPGSFSTSGSDFCATVGATALSPMFQHVLMLGGGPAIHDNLVASPKQRKSCFPLAGSRIPLLPQTLKSALDPVAAAAAVADYEECSCGYNPEDPFFQQEQKHSILNPLEKQLLWLGEESMYCFDASEFQFNFIHYYATAELRIELRKLDLDTSEADKIDRLVDTKDWQVREAFKCDRLRVRKYLKQGHRRPMMRLVIAEFRVARRMNVELERYPPMAALEEKPSASLPLTSRAL